MRVGIERRTWKKKRRNIMAAMEAQGKKRELWVTRESMDRCVESNEPKTV